MIKKLASFAAVSALGFALIGTPASAATSTQSWGYWQSEADVVNFPDATGLVNATWSVSGADSYNLYSSDDDDEYFVASTPIGGVFGATPSTGSLAGDNYLKVEISIGTDSTVDIDFASEVPANRLALAIGDIDYDHVTVTMKDGSNNDLTAAQIKGSATTLAFNYCTYTPVAGACSGDSDVATLTEGATSVTATGSNNGSDGSSFWVRPSAGVKSIRLVMSNDDETSTSTQRVWLAQLNVDEEPSVTLAETGADSSTALWMASLGLLLAGAAARRFATKRN